MSDLILLLISIVLTLLTWCLLAIHAWKFFKSGEDVPFCMMFFFGLLAIVPPANLAIFILELIFFVIEFDIDGKLNRLLRKVFNDPTRNG